MTPVVQLGCNCAHRCTLPAPSRSRPSRYGLPVTARAVTQTSAPAQAPARQPSLQHLEDAFQAPTAAPAQPLPDRAEASAQLESAGAAVSAAAPAASPPVSAARRNIILLDGDTLDSTDEHRAWVAGGLTLFGSLFTVGACQIHDLPSALSATAAAATAFLTAGPLRSPDPWSPRMGYQ